MQLGLSAYAGACLLKDIHRNISLSWDTRILAFPYRNPENVAVYQTMQLAVLSRNAISLSSAFHGKRLGFSVPFRSLRFLPTLGVLLACYTFSTTLICLYLRPGFSVAHRSFYSISRSSCTMAAASSLSLTTSYKLPTIVDEEISLHNPDTSLLSKRLSSPISVKNLAAAVQRGCAFETIKRYLRTYEPIQQNQVSKDIQGIPLIFHAAESNSVPIVELLLNYGARPDTKCLIGGNRVPLLAFVICYGGENLVDTTEMVKTLLAWGANPVLLPRSLWFPIKEPRHESLGQREIDQSTYTNWCRSNAYSDLRTTLHLSHRYLLHRASIIEKPSDCEVQIATNHGMSDLLKVPYYLVG